MSDVVTFIKVAERDDSDPHSSRGTGKGGSIAWIGNYDVRGSIPPMFSTHVISPIEGQSNPEDHKGQDFT
jgi:hypothetical protein